MSSLVLTLKMEETEANVIQNFQLTAGQPREEAVALEILFRSLASGARRGVILVQTASADPVGASATATLASVQEDDTITIGKTTLTAKASPANENQFSQAGTDTQDAASLAAVINAHSVLSKYITATSSAAVVTITAQQKGITGNQIVLTSSNARITVTGSGYLANGAGGTEDAGVTYNLGIT